jgi:hypothetical protein
MQTEILYEGPGYTIARTDKAGTLVPYGPAPRPSGAMNYGWIDLRDRPDRVAEIPEAARSKGLSNLLRVIADPVSRITSIGCDCHAFERSTTEGDGPRWSVGGYVAVTFKDTERNLDPDNFAEMARYLLSGIGASSEHHIGFEMIVEPLKFFFGRTDCHALTIKPIGWGNDEPQAWAAFDYAAEAAADAIQKGHKGRPSPGLAPPEMTPGTT